MGKSLVITEKPSVAVDIAAALGGFTEHDGYSESDDYVVTFAVGHLFELLSPEEVDEKYKAWTLEVLPILPNGEFQIKPKKGHSERIRTIKKLLARDDVETVVNACDAGREGELIFREIIKYLGSEKPIRRLWLQSMTTRAIKTGFGSLRDGEEFLGLAAAAECRAFSDWLIGMNSTRALTKRFASRKERTAWSAGRVQTPTLALMVDRELEVLAHVPRPYWRVVGTFGHGDQTYTGTWFDPDFKKGDDEEAAADRIFDQSRAEAITQAAAGEGGVASETRKPSRETAPPLFDLTSLQREANRRFGWSARRALSAAQRCYERHKLLTYPRTDSRCLPSDYRETVDQVLTNFSAAASVEIEGFDDYARAASHLKEAGLQNEARTFDDKGVSDHFAIIPTGNMPQEEFTGDDKRLFDLVTRRFLATFHTPAIWERVERFTDVGSERFQTRTRSLKDIGWRSVLAGAGEDEAEDTSLAPLVAGEATAEGVPVEAREVASEEEQTKPPPRISEARLLSLMENAGRQIEDEELAAVLREKGIGTPATRAEVIENLIRKGYVVRQGKALRPTVKGIRLIDSLRRIQIDRLASPALTGELEQHLQEVEKGTRSADQFMQEVTKYAVEVVERAKTFGYEELYADVEPLGPCPSCGRPVLEMAWFYRCTPVAENAEEDCPMRFWKDTSGRYLDSGAVRALLKDGETPILDGFTARNGRTYRAHIEIDRDEWKLKVRSAGWNEESASDIPEYEVNSEPLGPCLIDPSHQIIETSTEFSCALRLESRAEKEKAAAEQKAKAAAEAAAAAAAGEDVKKTRRKKQAPDACTFVLPRTVCKREITRDEALYYLGHKRTELLTDFTSRFGRPFSATLVLQDTGRHGFEFQPRKGAAGGKKATGKKATGKKAAGKKAAGKKAAGKKAAGKKAAGKKAAGKKKAKSGTRKKAAARKSAGEDSVPVSESARLAMTPDD